MTRPARVLLVYRHPTPYRDPLFDRLAELPDLHPRALYLDQSFPATPWARGELGHEHAFPKAWARATIAGVSIGVHPGAVADMLKFRPDACVLSGWNEPTVMALAAACRLRGIPYVLAGESFDGSMLGGWAGGARRGVVRALVGGASAWLPAGSRARDYFCSMGAVRDRCHRCPTAPDARAWAARVSEIRRTRPRLREERGLPPDGVFVFVGRLVDSKAVDVLMAAFGILRARRPECVLVLAGDGPLRGLVEAHPAAAGTRVLGFVQQSEVAEVLAAADVFVMPSRRETWCAAACEALAAGLPVVLSDVVGSAPDLIHDGDTGAVVPPEDAPALADAMIAVLDRPDRRGALAERARHRSLDWGHDRCLRSILAALRDCGVTSAAGEASESRT